MNRRSFLIGLVLLASMRATLAHTPYRQWTVYRRKHLLIGSHRRDPTTYELAKLISNELVDSLPESRSRVARAPNSGRLASLIGTDQLDIAVLSESDAKDMHEGKGVFKSYGKLPIRLLAIKNSYFLVAHERLNKKHAWLITSSLYEHNIADKVNPADKQVLDWHEGAFTYLSGQSMPD